MLIILDFGQGDPAGVHGYGQPLHVLGSDADADQPVWQAVQDGETGEEPERQRGLTVNRCSGGCVYTEQEWKLVMQSHSLSEIVQDLKRAWTFCVTSLYKRSILIPQTRRIDRSSMDSLLAWLHSVRLSIR